MLHLHPLPIFQDNYVWVLHDGHAAVVVDPGTADPVTAFLQQQGLGLQAILLTHHHPDHTGGVAGLRQRWSAPVYGGAQEKWPAGMGSLERALQDQDTLHLLGQAVEVLSVPGHTLGHVAYHWPAQAGLERPLLFCGDTLFSGGCGRLFEGTASDMLGSLTRLQSLPDTTWVCAAHEYTLANLRFAQALEPDNPDLAAYVAHCQRQRAQGRPTLPSTVGQEKAINPFLRSHLPSIRTALAAQDGTEYRHDSDWFASLRAWKNRFV